MITSEQVKRFERLTGDTLGGKINITEREAQRALGRGDEIMERFTRLIHEKGENPHRRISSYFNYPKGYSGAKDLDEQATILREQYRFPLKKPLARVKKLPEEAEGLWVIPLIQDIVPLQCEYPYNYAVDFVLERLGRTRELTNRRQDKTDHIYLQQREHSRCLWNQLMLAQGNGKLTPVVPAQFGIMHRGESVNYVWEDVIDNEILFGVYPIGVMLLTHPEREQKWEQLHIDCAGDTYASDEVPIFSCDKSLFFATGKKNLQSKQFGSVSGFIPQE